MKSLRKKCIILLLCLAGVSCSEDFLERPPLDAPSSDAFLNTEAELEAAVTAIYRSLWYNEPWGHLLFDFASDDGWDRNQGSSIAAIARGELDADNGFALGIWSNSYNAIARANYIVSNSDGLQDEMDPEKYDRLLGEARFLRAYHYSYLTQLFGAVPLLIEETSLEDAQMERTPKSEVVDFILSELNAVTDLLPSAPNEKHRVTKGLALGLTSRVALWNERYDVAAQAASNLISSGTYSLHPDYVELFRYAGENSPEIIWSVPYEESVNFHNLPVHTWSRMDQGQSAKVPTKSIIDTYAAIDGLPIDESPLYDPQNPYENRDPRLGYTFILPGSRGIRYEFNTNPEITTVLDYGVEPPQEVPNLEAPHPYSSFTGYLIRKHTDPLDYPGGIYRSELDVIIMRYAEILLNYAEAKIEMNDIDASVYEAINLVRSRPTVEMPEIERGKSQEELRSIIRKERRHELAIEGLRFFDIRRWGIVDEVMNGPVYGRVLTGFLNEAPEIDENGTPHYEGVSNSGELDVVVIRNFKPYQNLFPIPRIEVQVNPLLEPNNPGY